MSVFTIFICTALIIVNLLTCPNPHDLQEEEKILNDNTFRTITVYNEWGGKTATYKGKYKITLSHEGDNAYLCLTDAKGDKNVIFYGAGTITIDEQNSNIDKIDGGALTE